MLKGWAKADDTSIAWTLLGAAGATALNAGTGNKVKPTTAAAAGALVGLLGRAFADPALVNERKTA